MVVLVKKNANYDKNKVYGNIKENTPSGIFGDYTDALPDAKEVKVASKDEVKVGPATIRTVINNNEIKEYNINIIKIDKSSDIKNILFEITDEELLKKTGGVVQGMSGSQFFRII